MQGSGTVSQGIRDPASTAPQVILNWSENAAVQRLLDAVAAIIAEEYIRTARKNPEAFKEVK